MNNATIRPIEASDVQCLTRFFLSNDLPEVTRNFNPFPLSLETAEFIAFQKRRDKYYAVFFENEIIGFAMLRGWDEGYEIPSLGILIDSRHRGNGIGDFLLRYVIDVAKKESIASIRLTVGNDNIAAINLYEKLGFRSFQEISCSIVDGPANKTVMFLDVARAIG